MYQFDGRQYVGYIACNEICTHKIIIMQHMSACVCVYIHTHAHMHRDIQYPMGKYFIVGFTSVCIGCSNIMLFVKRLEEGGVCIADIITANFASLWERSS